MKTSKTLLSVAVLIFVTAIGSIAFGFRGFTNTKSVCLDCPQPKTDVIELKSGAKLRALVVGENSDFYSVYRYTELRAIPRDEIKNVIWASGTKPSELSSTDQILLKSGVVFSGKITENKTKPPVFLIKSDFNGYTYSLFKSQVESAYKSGSKLSF